MYLRSSVCFQLPSDSTSRWTPLLSANGRRSPAPVRDFHPIASHPCRAYTQRRAPSTGALPHFYSKLSNAFLFACTWSFNALTFSFNF
ncbi:hypothetical protein CWI35_12005 [[Bacillus] caldolyticus]|uniref:Uncharacterized protein n=1 Tax=Bacillus caldolyticus TaxID=1394 RepID=A0ABM6QNS5_BACCL|nr:hypothetical protein CWI35_12005 [[Bacillus] caldolyticus]